MLTIHEFDPEGLERVSWENRLEYLLQGAVRLRSASDG